MNRRKYLTLTSSTLFLAGCNSNSSGGGSDTTNSESGNPYFERVSVTGPDSVTVADAFSLEIEAMNTGARTGDFTTELTANPNAFNERAYQVVINDIEPGKSKRTTIGPLIPIVAGDFRFITEEYNAAHNLTSAPLRGARDDALQLANKLELTLDDLYLANGLFYSVGEDTVAVTQPEDDDHVFVVAYVTARNRSDSEISPYAGFTIATETDFIGSLWTTSDLVLSGEKFTREKPIPPGKTHSGWLIFQIERSAITSGIEFGYNVDLGVPAEAYWSAHGLSGGGAPPTFEPVLTPDEVEAVTTTEIVLEVANTGDFEGTYTDMLVFSELNSESVVGKMPAQGEVPADDTVQLSGELTLNYTGSLQVTSEVTGYSKTIDVIPAQHKFGDTVTTPTDLEITVNDLRLTFGDPITFEDDSTRDPHSQWMLAHVTVKNSGQEQYAPPLEAFKAKPEESPLIDPTFVHNSRSLSKPAQGQVYPVRGDSWNIRPGVSEYGWLLFDVSRKYSFKDIGVRWETADSNASGAVEWWR